MPELICKILHIGKTTYYKYLKNNYPILKFLMSFSKEELEELSSTGKIRKFELIKHLTAEELEQKLQVKDTSSNNTEAALIDHIKCHFDLNRGNFLQVKLESFFDLFEQINSQIVDLNINNAKVKVLSYLDGLNDNSLTKKIFSGTRRASLISILRDKYSSVEIYVLIKENRKLVL